MVEYRDGFNSQQDYLKAKFEFDADLERATTFVVFFIDTYRLFRIESRNDGYYVFLNKLYGPVILSLNVDGKCIGPIKNLEKYLDSLISSDEMANTISQLTRIKRFSATHNIWEQ